MLPDQQTTPQLHDFNVTTTEIPNLILHTDLMYLLALVTNSVLVWFESEYEHTKAVKAH